MKRALLSVSDKEGIVAFAKRLAAAGFEILSTGGTLKTLTQNGIYAIEVGNLTGYGELFDGRVKTLHPAIHGGILYRRGNASDEAAAQEKNIRPVDLVCVNLYPFSQTIARTDDFGEIIENIDIGGPAMVRSAAKNFKDVLIVTDPADYSLVAEAIEKAQDDEPFRARLMIKAYEHTAWYDSVIAGYMNERFERTPGFAAIGGHHVATLRYGENPHQKGALYQTSDFYDKNFRVIKGEASFNNLTDLSAAVSLARGFDAPAIAIVKHGNPCGFSLRDNLSQAWDEALRCDKLSAFGGVVAVNGIVDAPLAEKMNTIFIEVLVAPTVTAEAQAVFESKKRLKIFELGEGDRLPADRDARDYKRVLGGFVLQDADTPKVQEVSEAKCVTQKAVSADQMADLQIAWMVAALTKSNCVAYVKERTLVAVGMGMTSRVDAAACALKKAEAMGVDVSGAAMASEAFFPFRDSIDAAAQAKVSAIVQPGGSMRDEEVIAAADEHGMAMLLTGIRHFLH